MRFEEEETDAEEDMDATARGKRVPVNDAVAADDPAEPEAAVNGFAARAVGQTMPFTPTTLQSRRYLVVTNALQKRPVGSCNHEC